MIYPIPGRLFVKSAGFLFFDKIALLARFLLYILSDEALLGKRIPDRPGRSTTTFRRRFDGKVSNS